MKKTCRLFFLLVLIGAIWYSQLDESQKRFVQNLVRQVPYLPARYMV